MNPKVTMIMVMSVNGIVAQREIQNSFEWNSTEDRKQFLKRIQDVGTVIMGANTYRSIGGDPYEGIEFYVLTHHPEKLPDNDRVNFVSGDVRDIYLQLEDKGLRQVALLGGSKTNTQFIEHRLVDDIYLTIEPLMMPEGMHIIDNPVRNISLSLDSVETLNQSGTLLLHYLVNRD